MTLEEAHTMIECQGVYEIIYRKDDTEHLWHISNIEMAVGYNEKAILAYCYEKDKDLTFSISKIVSAKRYWIDILVDDIVADKDGLYVLACMEDNYIGRRLAHINKGERFNDYAGPNWALAYHLVPEFSFIFSDGWLNNETESPQNALSIFAYRGDADIDCSSFEQVDCESGISYYLFQPGFTRPRIIPVKKGELTVLGRYDLWI